MIDLLRGLQGSLQRIERILASLILITILVTMVSQVAARYFFRAPFSWSEELCRFALVWLTFLAASYLMAQQRHISVDVWSHWVKPGTRRWADVAVHGTVTVTCLLLGVGSWEFVWYVHPVGSPALGIPRSFWYGGVSVGLLLMAFHSLTNGCLVLFGQREIVREALPSEEALRLHWDAELPPPDAQGGRS